MTTYNFGSADLKAGGTQYWPIEFVSNQDWNNNTVASNSGKLSLVCKVGDVVKIAINNPETPGTRWWSNADDFTTFNTWVKDYCGGLISGRSGGATDDWYIYDSPGGTEIVDSPIGQGGNNQVVGLADNHEGVKTFTQTGPDILRWFTEAGYTTSYRGSLRIACVEASFNSTSYTIHTGQAALGTTTGAWLYSNNYEYPDAATWSNVPPLYLSVWNGSTRETNGVNFPFLNSSGYLEIRPGGGNFEIDLWADAGTPTGTYTIRLCYWQNPAADAGGTAAQEHEYHGDYAILDTATLVVKDGQPTKPTLTNCTNLEPLGWCDKSFVISDMDSGVLVEIQTDADTKVYKGVNKPADSSFANYILSAQLGDTIWVRGYASSSFDTLITHDIYIQNLDSPTVSFTSRTREADAQPNPFELGGPVTNADPDTYYPSSAGGSFTLTGFTENTSLFCDETTTYGTMQIKEGTSGWVTSLSNIAPDSLIYYRLLTENSPSSARGYNTTYTGRINCQGVIDTYSVTTKDATPAQFTLTDLTDQPLNTPTQTSFVATGWHATVDQVAFVQSGSAQIRKNGAGSWVTTLSPVYPNDTINILMTTSSSYNTSVECEIGLGYNGESPKYDTWTLTTEVDDVPTFTAVADIDNQEISSWSNQLTTTTVGGLTTGVNVTANAGTDTQITKDTIIGVPTNWKTAETVTNGTLLYVRGFTAATYETTKGHTVTSNGTVLNFNTITRGNPPDDPDNELVDVPGAVLGGYETTTFQVVNNSSAANITVNNDLQVWNGSSWGTTYNGVSSGTTVQLRCARAATYNTTNGGTITLTGNFTTVFADWYVTTKLDDDPNPIQPYFVDLTDQNVNKYVYETFLISDISTTITVTSSGAIELGVDQDTWLGQEVTFVSNNTTLWARMLTSSNYNTPVTGGVDANGVTATWSATTKQENLPSFSLQADIPNADLDTLYGNRQTTVSNLTETTVAYASGALQISALSGGPFGSEATLQPPSDTLYYQMRSSTNYNTAVSGSVSILGASDAWSITTIQDPSIRYGLKVWDALGNVKVDTSLFAARYIQNDSEVKQTGDTLDIPITVNDGTLGDGTYRILLQTAPDGTAGTTHVAYTIVGNNIRVTSSAYDGKTIYYWVFRRGPIPT